MKELDKLTAELKKAHNVKIYNYNTFRKVANKISSLNKKIEKLN